MTPEERLQMDLVRLGWAWQEEGIDPDAFVRCGTCHEYFVDENGKSRECACERSL
jgi:hypothetical protein